MFLGKPLSIFQGCKQLLRHLDRVSVSPQFGERFGLPFYARTALCHVTACHLQL
jgi:hypothetical protein